jgi:ribonuclease HI
MSAIAPPLPDLGPVARLSAPPSDEAEIPTPVRIYTDGSILKNPGGEGGWAMVATKGIAVVEVKSGGVPVSTNNRMELWAVREALAWATSCDEEVEVVTDSQYVQKGLTEYLTGWKVRDWRKVKNRDLWEQLDILYVPERMVVSWIKGHAGHRFNELADELAGVAARLVRDHA